MRVGPVLPAGGGDEEVVGVAAREGTCAVPDRIEILR